MCRAAVQSTCASGFCHCALKPASSTDKVRALYARGDFDAAYGRTLDDLVTEWEKFLDALPLDASAANQAFGRIRKGSLITRPCAREVAKLQLEAAELRSRIPKKR